MNANAGHAHQSNAYQYHAYQYQSNAYQYHAYQYHAYQYHARQYHAYQYHAHQYHAYQPMLTAISASVSVFSLLWLGVGEVPPPRRDATAPFSLLGFCLSKIIINTCKTHLC